HGVAVRSHLQRQLESAPLVACHQRDLVAFDLAGVDRVLLVRAAAGRAGNRLSLLLENKVSARLLIGRHLYFPGPRPGNIGREQRQAAQQNSKNQLLHGISSAVKDEQMRGMFPYFTRAADCPANSSTHVGKMPSTSVPSAGSTSARRSPG